MIGLQPVTLLSWAVNYEGMVIGGITGPVLNWKQNEISKSTFETISVDLHTFGKITVNG